MRTVFIFENVMHLVVDLRCALQRLEYLVEAEAARLLPWWELLERCQMLRNEALRRDQHKRMVHAPATVVDRLVVGPLVRVGSQTEQLGKA